MTDYDYIDENPFPGRSYYRLKQVDFDGTIAYSPVVTILNSESPILAVFPNPSASPESVQLKLFNTTGSGPSLISITDSTGKLLSAFQADLSDGLVLGEIINASRLRSGVFTIKVLHGARVFVHKLIIY